MSIATTRSKQVIPPPEFREEGIIKWSWVVDETRELEKVSTWDDPGEYMQTVMRCYRRDFWSQQPKRVEVWSEKGTIRGVLQPVLDDYGVGFRVMHGFGSATILNDVAQSDNENPLTILYVGDYDPSGLWMSEEDIPERSAPLRRRPCFYQAHCFASRRL